MKKLLSALCNIICFIFDLMVLGGVLILIGGTIMSLTKIGTDTDFYKFFNDSPIGWIIIFGSIIVGGAGRFAFAKIMSHFDITTIWDLLPSSSGGGSVNYSNEKNHDERDSSSYDSSESSSTSSWPYEYGTMRDSYGNETEVTHNTITDTYTDSAGHEYKSDDGGNTFYEISDDE